MNTFLRIVGTIVALVLIFAGGVDFYVTTLPGLALLAVIWGFKI